MTKPPSRTKNRGGGFPSLIPSIIFSIHMSDALRTGMISARKPLSIRRNFQILPSGSFLNGFQFDIIYLPT